MKSDYIEIGVISSPHGIKGEVKIRSFTENPANIAKLSPLLLGEEKRILELGKISVNKDKIIASIKGISDRNAAAAISGQSIYVSRSILPDLKESEYYQNDLIGLDAMLENGEKFGKIIAFHDFGAGDLVEVKLINGKEKILPFDKKTIVKVNVAEGFLVVNPPEEV